MVFNEGVLEIRNANTFTQQSITHLKNNAMQLQSVWKAH